MNRAARRTIDRLRAIAAELDEQGHHSLADELRRALDVAARQAEEVVA